MTSFFHRGGQRRSRAEVKTTLLRGGRREHSKIESLILCVEPNVCYYKTVIEKAEKEISGRDIQRKKVMMRRTLLMSCWTEYMQILYSWYSGDLNAMARKFNIVNILVNMVFTTNTVVVSTK